MRLVPLALLTAFAVADLLAGWRVAGMVSVSEQVWALGWVGRVAGAVVMLALAAHLALRWPFGP